jgi:hypothetical protein
MILSADNLYMFYEMAPLYKTFSANLLLLGNPSYETAAVILVQPVIQVWQ